MDLRPPSSGAWADWLPSWHRCCASVLKY